MSTITRESFGKLKDGREAFLYSLRNTKGTEVKLTNYGARLVSWIIRDKDFQKVDVLLGLSSAADYEKDNKFFGAIVGRHANRIGGAEFTLNGVTYHVDKNDGSRQQNHLHGGPHGFFSKLWEAEETKEGVLLTYVSPDGEAGVPGTMTTKVLYGLSNDNELSIRYEAVSDQDTVCNLTNHAYFNLDGFAAGSVEKQRIQLFADSYTWADAESLPDGRILKVDGTPMDLRELTEIGAHIGEDFDQLKMGRGYDHNFCIREEKPKVELEQGAFGYDIACPIDYNDGGLKKAAYAEGAKSGITLTMYTTLPGMQFYSGNFLDADMAGKDGVKFPFRSGFCLEAQYYPNALHHPEFAQPILKKGEVFRAQTVYVLKNNK